MYNHLIEQDKVHRRLALDPTQSFIVQAPAGSGKTELLIQRFLTLLLHVKHPEEILAITFTKKAANEMRLRIIKALKQASYQSQPDADHQKKTWILAKQVLERDKQFQWQIMQNPSQFRLQTIDSLCAYLTKQLPLLSHFGSQPDISDHPHALYCEATQEVMMHLEEKLPWSAAIGKLLLHLDNDLNKLHDLLVSLLAKRDQWISYLSLNENPTEIKKILEQQLNLVIQDTLKNLISLFPQDNIQELISILRFSAENSHEPEFSSCLALTTLPGYTASDQSAWLAIAKLLLTKQFTWRKRVDAAIGFPPLKSLDNSIEKNLHQEYRQRLMDLILQLQDHEPFRLALVELFYLPQPRYTQDQWEILSALLQVLKIVAAQLRVTFQKQGKIDFIENTQGALIALGDEDTPTDLALALDYQIKHILMDEFQDTSYTQYQLLKKLTQGWEAQDGRSLFIVGDPMQSIYRFREAEVGLFIRMRQQGLPHLALTPLTLSVNFRSNARIVEWNNLHFSAIFPPNHNMATGAVAYNPSVSPQVLLEDNKQNISVKGLIDADDAIEAKQVVAIVEETLNKFPDDNLAILVRSRSHLKAIIPSLKKAKISFSAVDIDALASQQMIQDLLALTCAMLHPADRISWLAVLRAPWCGLTLSDLFIIAGQEPYASIYSQLQQEEVLKKLSQDGRQRVQHLFRILSYRLAAREREDRRCWIENTWLLLGGPSYLSEYSSYPDVEAFFKLLEKLNDNYTSFDIDKLKYHIDQLYANTSQPSRLQIMTIHSAKGLEFDTVIIPQLHKKTVYDDQALLAWMDRPLVNKQSALLLAPLHGIGKENNSIYEYITRQQRIKAAHETERLFYVAATRAKKRLILFFNIASRNSDRNYNDNCDNHYKIEPGSFLEKIWPQWKNKASDILEKNFNNNEIVTKKTNKLIQRVTSDWTNPIKPMLFSKTVLHKNKLGFQLIDNTARVVGIIVHRMLQQLSQAGIPWWTKLSKQQKTNVIQNQLRGLSIANDKNNVAHHAIFKAINNVLTDEKGKWILHHYSFSKSEYAITAVINGEIENLIIDRLFVDDKHVLWIIDYKTVGLNDDMDDSNDVDLVNVLLKEQDKYKEQMQKYYMALKEKHEGEIRMGLYFPLFPAWRELGNG